MGFHVSVAVDPGRKNNNFLLGAISKLALSRRNVTLRGAADCQRTPTGNYNSELIIKPIVNPEFGTLGMSHLVIFLVRNRWKACL